MTKIWGIVVYFKPEEEGPSFVRLGVNRHKSEISVAPKPLGFMRGQDLEASVRNLLATRYVERIVLEYAG